MIYISHKIANKGMEPDSRTIQGIIATPSPTSKAEVGIPARYSKLFC